MRNRRADARTRSRAVMALGACLFVAATSVQAQNPVAELRVAATRFIDLVNRGDSAAVVRMYVNRPGVATLGDGDVTTGWSGVAEAFGQLLRLPGLQIEVRQPMHVTMLGNDAGLVFFQYLLTAPQNQNVEGAITLAFVRTPQGWGIIHDHTSSRTESLTPSPRPDPEQAALPRAPVRPTRECIVTRVVDGDTLYCRGIGSVRLIGMDSPEMDQGSFGLQAAQALIELAPLGAALQLERDVEARDRYDRTLGYLWKGDTLLNWRMVRDGWAVLLTYPPNVLYVDALVAAQRLAREERRGLWAVDGFACAPVDRRRRSC